MTALFGAFFLLTATTGVGLPGAGLRAMPLSDEAIAEHSQNIFFGTPDQRSEALRKLTARGNADVAPALILAMRYFGKIGRAHV